MSLWTVDDAATTELMVEFYRELAATKSPAMALRAAQVKLMREGRTRFSGHPS